VVEFGGDFTGEWYENMNVIDILVGWLFYATASTTDVTK
jgi:hypothetical protein